MKTKINFQKLSPEKLSAFCFKLFLIVFPFQIQTLLYKADFFSGQFNFFSSFFFSLGEILLLLTVFFHGLDKIFGKKKENIYDHFSWTELVMAIGLLGLIVITLTSSFWATDKVLALLQGLRYLELGVFVYLIIKEILPKEILLRYLFWGAFLQVIIGLGQYLKQADLGLSWLGEPRLGADYLNIAKVNLGGEKILRSYGTFPHANVFGGYLFVCLTLLLQNTKKENYLANAHFFVAFLIGLLISFSRSSWLAALALLLFLVAQQAFKINWKQLLFALVMLTFILVVFSLDKIIWARIINFSFDSWDERLVFSGVAKEMILNNPLLGVGAGNFVLVMPKYFAGTLYPWLFQPVHNFFLMIASELGILGIASWSLIIGTSVKMVIGSMHRLIKSERFQAKTYFALLFGMMVLSLLDHYFYTIWSGQILVFLIIGLIWLDYRRRRVELHK